MIGMTVCSGIGAPEMAAPWIDWRFQSEIEPFPCAVLAKRFPNAVNLGDMTKFEEWPDEPIDLLCGGTPCQDASIGYAAGTGRAGAGLDGSRSGLAASFVGVAKRYQPRAIVWENVPNLLSARLAAGFLDFAQSIADLGYHLAWRVLDGRWFGLRDQPRPRLYLVGHTDPRAASAILLEPQCPSWDRKAKKEAAPVLTARGGMAYDDRTPCVLEPGGARIATPEEWERALGFPAGFTRISWGKKSAADCPRGPRYRALGNAWDVSVGKWIFDRIKMVEEMT